MNPETTLPYGLNPRAVQAALTDFLDFLSFIDGQLASRGLAPLERLLMPAGFSGLVGEFVAASLARHFLAVTRNHYHNGYPDLVPVGIYPGDAVQHGSQGIEVKASRHHSGWQGHNVEDGWLMVIVFEAGRAAGNAGSQPAGPFRFRAVYAAYLLRDDWAFPGRSGASRRTITASVRRSGFEKLTANWVYRG